MLFQDAPATLDGIVLAMVRRQVNQLDRNLVTIDELHQPLHELRAGAGDLRSVVEFDVESLDAAVERFPLGPP
jgi:hypothetical protein